MKRAIALTVALLGGVAHADGPPLVQAPPGWSADLEQSKQIAAKANEVSQFGGASALAAAEVYVAPSAKATLFVTAIAGKVKDNREAAARVAVDSFLGAPKRMQLVSPKVFLDISREKVDAATKSIVAELAWRDDEAKTATQALLVIVADAENLVSVTAECVTSAETSLTDKGACATALWSIDPGIPTDKRVALALAPAGTEPPPGPDATGPKPSQRPPATMEDGSRAPLPPIQVQSETKRTTDRRPVYLGLGLVLLAAVFWWNRRRRDRFEAKENDE